MNWIPEAKRLLRAIDREATLTPLYIVDYGDVQDFDARLSGGPCLAWTAPTLCTMLEDYLVARGEWRGPGFATIVHRADCRDDAQAIGACLHEYAHYVEFERSSDPVPAISPESARSLLPHRWASPDSADEGARRGRPLWHGHDSRFVLAAAILAHRARCFVPSFAPQAIGFGLYVFGAAYPEERFMQALRPFIAARGPVRTLAQARPPETFRQLYDRATGEQPAGGWDPALPPPPPGAGPSQGAAYGR